MNSEPPVPAPACGGDRTVQWRNAGALALLAVGDRLLKTLIAMPSSSALDRADPLGERRVAGNPLNHLR
jgi:hypothetical protein